MKFLEFLCPPDYLELLRSSVAATLERFTGRLPRAMQRPEDPEMALIWTEELQGQFDQDASTLLKIISDPGFGEGEYRISEEDLESLVRAVSGVRLAIRRTAFSEFSDTELQNLVIHPLEMSPQQRAKFVSYEILGALQSFALKSLDPEIAAAEIWEEDEENRDPES